MKRQDAFDFACMLARTGMPIHPKMHDQLSRAVGPLTADESKLLVAAVRARKAADERSALEMITLTGGFQTTSPTDQQHEAR